MAATFLQAMVAAYGGLSNVPTLWSEQVADTTTTYPRAELMSLGETAVYSSQGVVEFKTARAQLSYYNTSLADVDNTCATIMAGLTFNSVTINNTATFLSRTNYQSGIDMERTTQQQPIFAGRIEYTCEIPGGA